MPCRLYCCLCFGRGARRSAGLPLDVSFHPLSLSHAAYMRFVTSSRELLLFVCICTVNKRQAEHSLPYSCVRGKRAYFLWRAPLYGTILALRCGAAFLLFLYAAFCCIPATGGATVASKVVGHHGLLISYYTTFCLLHVYSVWRNSLRAAFWFLGRNGFSGTDMGQQTPAVAVLPFQTDGTLTGLSQFHAGRCRLYGGDVGRTRAGATRCFFSPDLPPYACLLAAFYRYSVTYTTYGHFLSVCLPGPVLPPSLAALRLLGAWCLSIFVTCGGCGAYPPEYSAGAFRARRSKWAPTIPFFLYLLYLRLRVTPRMRRLPRAFPFRLMCALNIPLSLCTRSSFSLLLRRRV